MWRLKTVRKRLAFAGPKHRATSVQTTRNFSTASKGHSHSFVLLSPYPLSEILCTGPPVIDAEQLFSDADTPSSKTLREIRQGLSEWGFFVLVNHGVNDGMINTMHQFSRDFFALPLDQKNTCRRSKDNARGFYDNE